MIRSEGSRTAPHRAPARGSSPRRAALARDGLGTPDSTAPAAGLSVFGCRPDEAAAFRETAPQFDLSLTLTEEAVSESNVELAAGRRCISVGHKARIANPVLRSLRDVGVRYVSTRSAGRDHIDVDFARSLGITVEGVAYSPDSVADYTVMLMLMVLRNARSVIVRAEAHDFRLNAVRGAELRDMTVGVIGTGRIGAAVIDRLRGFGCRVLAFDRSPKTNAHYVGLDELLRRSDVVTLHTPLTRETTHLLGREQIGRLKRGAVVINTGRGPLLDTETLVSALENDRLGGAGLDVLEDEDDIFYADRRDDPIDDELFLRLQRLPNALVTPHTAYYIDHALRDTVANTVLNCLEFERRLACPD